MYNDLGRLDFVHLRYVFILKYWFKVIECSDRKFINNVYTMMIRDIDIRPEKRTGSLVLETCCVILVSMRYG